MVLLRDLWNFSFFGRRDVSPTHSEHCRFVSGSQTKHKVSSPVIILLKKICVCIGQRENVLARCDSIFPLLRCQAVWNKTCTQLSFPNPLSESEKLQSWECSKILLSFLMKFDGHFWSYQHQQQCLPHFESILDGQFSRHLPPAPFRLKIENTTQKRLIGSEPHSHKPYAPMSVFLSQTDRLGNKILWQLSVHFRHLWRITETDFTSYNLYTVEDKRTKFGAWTDVDW